MSSLPLEHRIVQMADIIASRRPISFFPGIYLDLDKLNNTTEEELGKVIRAEEKQALSHRARYAK